MTRSTQPGLPQPGDDLFLEHQLHFVRDAGQAGDRRPADLHPDAGCRPDRVRQRLGSLGKERLDAVALGHHAIAAGKHGGDRRQRFGIFDQRHAGALGQRLARQVVLGRPQAAGHHDQVGPLAGDPEDRQMVFQHVAQGRVERDRDPQAPRAAD